MSIFYPKYILKSFISNKQFLLIWSYFLRGMLKCSCLPFFSWFILITFELRPIHFMLYNLFLHFHFSYSFNFVCNLSHLSFIISLMSFLCSIQSKSNSFLNFLQSIFQILFNQFFFPIKKNFLGSKKKFLEH